jgi:hypothetical protein
MTSLRRRRSSQTRTLFALGAVILAVAIVVIVAESGAGSNPSTATTVTAPLPTPNARIRLLPPNGRPGEVGIAEIVRRGDNAAIAIVAKGVPPNAKHTAYAVWLYNSPGDVLRLGFVNPNVGKNGHLDTTGVLPASAGHYRQLLITLERVAAPATPGPVVLRGTL